MWHLPKWRAYGERGVLLEALQPELRDFLAEKAALDFGDQLAESVDGFDTLLLLFHKTPDAAAVDAWLGTTPAASRRRTRRKARSLKTVDVRYDGPDLQALAKAKGLTVEAVIQRHTAPEYRVRMIGFAPGFPYLEGLDPRLHTDRHASPRDRIEPGSVAIGGEHTGIYPVSSPGGWWLLGNTEYPLFAPDAARTEVPTAEAVFGLLPGDRIRFRSV